MAEMAETDPLIERVLDGTASATEHKQLIARLESEPDLRQAWWAEIAWRSHLRQTLAAARGAASGRRFATRRQSALRRLPVWPVALAAAAVLVVGVTVWLLAAASLTSPASDAAAPVPSLAGEFASDREVRLTDGTWLRFKGAAYRIETADGGHVSLHSGRVEAEVAPRPPGHPLRITTPHGEAVIVGTRFSLVVDNVATLLRVTEGTVRFAGRPVVADESLLAGAWGLAARTICLDPTTGPTLAEVAGKLGPGDAIVLADGEYVRGGDDAALGQIVVDATADRPARFCAMPGTRPTLRSRGWDVLRVRGRHLVLSGIDFAGAADGTGNGLVLEAGANLRITGCRFTGFGGDGLNARGIDGLVIEDCEVIGNGARSSFGQGGIGIFRGSGEADIVLRRLHISGNRTGPINRVTGSPTGGHGLWLGRDGGARPRGSLRIESCRIIANQGPGITLLGAGAVDVRDCRLIGNGGGPVGDLRAQLTATGDSQVELTASILASDPGVALIRLWPPAAVARAVDNRVWGGSPPFPGFTALEAAPSREDDQSGAKGGR